MEKSKRSKSDGNILKLIKRNVSMPLSKPPYSPTHPKLSKQMSGPIVSMIPPEIRGRRKNENFRLDEPTSPKVSCLGQIKYKKRESRTKKNMPPKPEPKPSFIIPSIFRGRKNVNATVDVKLAVQPPLPQPPRLGHMKKFMSGRETFTNLDLNKPEVPEYHSFQKTKDLNQEDEDDEIIISHSAPIVMSHGDGAVVAPEPKKEINLWKRRTLDPPKPLRLNTAGRKN